jgi:hypothetical protein
MTNETTKHSHRRGPKPDRRRALELLAASRDDCSEALKGSLTARYRLSESGRHNSSTRSADLYDLFSEVFALQQPKERLWHSLDSL